MRRRGEDRLINTSCRLKKPGFPWLAGLRARVPPVRFPTLWRMLIGKISRTTYGRVRRAQRLIVDWPDLVADSPFLKRGALPSESAPRDECVPRCIGLSRPDAEAEKNHFSPTRCSASFTLRRGQRRMRRQAIADGTPGFCFAHLLTEQSLRNNRSGDLTSHPGPGTQRTL